MGGPLFSWELVRLARRGRDLLLRCAYALLLLAVWCLVYLQRSPSDNAARFADSSVFALLIVQGLVAVVLTPAYVAGAIADEKERKTLELLCTTPLRSREIVLGKLLGRVAHLVGILLTGVPILCLAVFGGDADPVIPAAVLIVTALTLLSLGALSILCSVQAETVPGAVAAAYFVSLFISLSGPALFSIDLDGSVSSPFFFAYGLRERLRDRRTEDSTVTAAAMVGRYALVHGVIFLGSMAWAIWDLRRRLQMRVPEKPPAAAKEPASVKPGWVGWWKKVEAVPHLPVGERPFLWREMRFGHSSEEQLRGSLFPLYLALTYFIVITFAVLVLTAVGLVPLDKLAFVMNGVVRMLGGFIAMIALIFLAFRAIGSVARDRAQGTFEGLLCLPGEPAELLRAKWLGSILRQRRVAFGAVVMWGIGLVSATLHPLAVPLLLLTGTVHAAFLASLGLWLGLVCRDVRRAYFLMGLVLVLLCFSTYLLPSSESRLGKLLAVGFNPFYAQMFLGFSWAELGTILTNQDSPLTSPFYVYRGQVTLTGIGVGLPVLALAAWLFWWAGRRRFLREFAPPTAPVSCPRPRGQPTPCR
jgi:ABC-type transport system involved in multi-copper enzyme maturation permease subunit